MTSPYISIITIVKNGEKYLKYTIESVLSQSYEDIEYIVIDGASTDSTPDIIKSYETRLACWISEPDYGISNAFNKGISKCSGDIIGIINADDWYEPGAFSKVASAFEHYPDISIVCGSMAYWDKNRRLYIYPSMPEKLSHRMTINHPTVFVKKHIYEKYGLFREDFKYAMDYELLLRIYLQNEFFLSLPDIIANMRLRGKSYVGWKKSLYEVYRAKRLHNISFLQAATNYAYQYADRSFQNCLDLCGLDKIILKLKYKNHQARE